MLNKWEWVCTKDNTEGQNRQKQTDSGLNNFARMIQQIRSSDPGQVGVQGELWLLAGNAWSARPHADPRTPHSRGTQDVVTILAGTCVGITTPGQVLPGRPSNSPPVLQAPSPHSHCECPPLSRSAQTSAPVHLSVTANNSKLIQQVGVRVFCISQ